jgi:hypothetical protein
MEKKEADIARVLLTSLNKAEFKNLSGPELIQYAQSYQWLANKIKEIENPPAAETPKTTESKTVSMREPKK